MSRYDLLHSGPDFLSAYIDLLNTAKDFVYISTFRFENPENKKTKCLDKLFLAIAQANKRGVIFNVLVNLYSDTKRLSQINKKTALILKGMGISTRKPPGNTVNHAKLCIADDKKLILGSHNLTRHSFSTNFEVSLLTDDCLLVRGASHIFQTAYSMACPAF